MWDAAGWGRTQPRCQGSVYLICTLQKDVKTMQRWPEERPDGKIVTRERNQVRRRLYSSHSHTYLQADRPNGFWGALRKTESLTVTWIPYFLQYRYTPSCILIDWQGCDKHVEDPGILSLGPHLSVRDKDTAPSISVSALQPRSALMQASVRRIHILGRVCGG
jgi:hypothetical protein